MAFWETMTVAEMNVLLEKRGEPGIREGWNELIKKIEAIHVNRGARKRENKISHVSHDSPLRPAIYFFLCVKESAENKDWKGQTSQYVDSRHADLYLPVFRPNGNTRQLEYVFTNITSLFQVPYLSEDTTLDKAMNVVKAFNREQWNNGHGAQWLLESGLDRLKDILDKWDTCRAMWDAVKPEQAPQETGLDTFPELSQELLPFSLEDPEEQARREREAMRAKLREEDPTFAQIDDLVANGAKQIILTGAPGTGKTYSAGRAAQCLGDLLDGAEEDASCPLVQFHPSYDYTDFVEGLRPVQLEGKGEDSVSFVKVDGSFKAFCRRVAEANTAHTQSPKNDPDRKYFFLIDEINRADLSKVFGELMFCLEADKRGRPVETQYHNLPTYVLNEATGRFVPLAGDVFAKGFFIPENVILIGTMNDIDRSVESMDFALRRRFEFREVEVTEKLLEKAFEHGGFGPVLEKEESRKDAVKRILGLNGVISGMDRDQGGQLGLSRHYHISQGQFAHLPSGKTGDLKQLMQYVWDYRIRSLLEEYLRGFTQKEVDGFLTACAAALGVDVNSGSKSKGSGDTSGSKGSDNG